jgi:hypothetical protein
MTQDIAPLASGRTTFCATRTTPALGSVTVANRNRPRPSLGTVSGTEGGCAPRVGGIKLSWFFVFSSGGDPRRCLSYKADVRDAGAPLAECCVVYFHGSPRPWCVQEPWIPPCAMSDMQELAEVLTARIAHLRAQLGRLQCECTGLRAGIKAIYDSRSWRMTTPLRAITQWARRSPY